MTVQEQVRRAGIARAVVTGAAGFIGAHLVRRLREAGADVTAVVRTADVSVPDAVVADVTVPGALDSLLADGCVVFHLAGRTDVAGSVRDPLVDFSHNLGGLLQVLESARRARARVVFPSSAAVFDPASDLPLAEGAPRRPSSPYGAAKLAGEAYCAAYHRCYGLDVRVARLFNVYGPGMRKFAIHDMIRRLQANPAELVILGDGEQIRDYLFVDDAVEGLILIAAAGAPGEDYNLASGTPVRMLDLAARVARAAQCPDAVIRPTGQSFEGDVPRWFADTTKVKQLGFEPHTSLDDGLAATVAALEGPVAAVESEARG